ncbi:integrase [Pseudomonas aeruginosa]|nr:integrase [Pseudomonas aeruginosa]
MLKKGDGPKRTKTHSEPLGERGAGSMLLERRTNGSIEVYLSWRRNGGQERMKLGVFGALGADGHVRGLAFWRREAAQISAQARPFSNLAAYEERRRLDQSQSERQVSLEAQQGSLEQLLKAYVDNLKRREKSSAKDVGRSLELNVLQAFPDLAQRRAKDISAAELSDVLRLCIHRQPALKGRGVRKTVANAVNGKRTMANRLRSYLRAAYAYGLKHDLDPLRAGDSIQFGLTQNPAAMLPTIDGAERANTDSLTKDELRHLLLGIDAMDEPQRAIARCMVYLGGQRVAMLVRATRGSIIEVDGYGSVLALTERKGGKGAMPRDHLLPLTPRLQEYLKPLLQASAGSVSDPLFSVRTGRQVARDTALQLFSELGAELAGKGLARKFTWRMVRASIETHLAQLGVDEQRRAWLLSHGRNGVQARHYDRYHYLREKREDLELLGRYLDEVRVADSLGRKG